jgi:hypothetical protein
MFDLIESTALVDVHLLARGDILDEGAAEPF